MAVGAHYDRQGNEVTSEEWARLFDQEGYQRVAQTTLDDGTWISTVWIGLDYRFRDDQPLAIFETMVFPKDNFEEQDMQRYATEEEARAGHEAMVETWRAKALEDAPEWTL